MLSGVLGWGRGRVLSEGRSGVQKCVRGGGCLPPPRRGVPSWPLLPLRTRAVFSLECSTGRTAGRSQIERRDGKTGRGDWGWVREKFRNKILSAKISEGEGYGRGGG